MKTDIILCGVGGQGILSIATIIGEAAMKAVKAQVEYRMKVCGCDGKA